MKNKTKKTPTIKEPQTFSSITFHYCEIKINKMKIYWQSFLNRFGFIYFNDALCMKRSGFSVKDRRWMAKVEDCSQRDKFLCLSVLRTCENISRIIKNMSRFNDSSFERNFFITFLGLLKTLCWRKYSYQPKTLRVKLAAGKGRQNCLLCNRLKFWNYLSTGMVLFWPSENAFK